jgi:hypothetical protein
MNHQIRNEKKKISGEKKWGDDPNPFTHFDLEEKKIIIIIMMEIGRIFLCLFICFEDFSSTPCRVR